MITPEFDAPRSLNRPGSCRYRQGKESWSEGRVLLLAQSLAVRPVNKRDRPLRIFFDDVRRIDRVDLSDLPADEVCIAVLLIDGVEVALRCDTALASAFVSRVQLSDSGR